MQTASTIRSFLTLTSTVSPTVQERLAGVTVTTSGTCTANAIHLELGDELGEGRGEGEEKEGRGGGHGSGFR